MRVLVYLDDFLLIHQDPVVLGNQLSHTVSLFRKLGWSVNLQKSILTPAREIVFLGIVWNTEKISKGYQRKI